MKSHQESNSLLFSVLAGMVCWHLVVQQIDWETEGHNKLKLAFGAFFFILIPIYIGVLFVFSSISVRSIVCLANHWFPVDTVPKNFFLATLMIGFIEGIAVSALAKDPSLAALKASLVVACLGIAQAIPFWFSNRQSPKKLAPTDEELLSLVESGGLHLDEIFIAGDCVYVSKDAGEFRADSTFQRYAAFGAAKEAALVAALRRFGVPEYAAIAEVMDGIRRARE